MAYSFNSWLTSLFRRHHYDAVRFATRLVGSRDNGEEIVQNAWVKLCARTAETPILHPKTYLFTATRNAAIDFATREYRERKYRVDVDSLTDADVADDTVRQYELRRQLAIIAISLNELPSPCRKAFVLNKLEGRTHREIAQKLGISVSMVEKHIVRALLHCRNLVS